MTVAEYVKQPSLLNHLNPPVTRPTAGPGKGVMKLDQPITLNLVKLFKGIVDFYYWKGIPVARRWPRDPHQPGTPKQKATWANLTNMYAELKLMPLQYHSNWKDVSLPHGRSTTDLKRKTLMRVFAAGKTPKYAKVAGIWRRRNATSTTDLVYIYISPQPGRNMADIQWHYKRFLTKPPSIKWMQTGVKMQRQHAIEGDFKPDIALWPLPDSQSFEAAFDRYEIVLPAWTGSFAFNYVVL